MFIHAIRHRSKAVVVMRIFVVPGLDIVAVRLGDLVSE